ncbi:MAG: hypothetical protein KW793_03790 [Candidatus Doudnabacteria bacterium]|nr:hypothetical protein [Candidatus Doudnabacteria bacterium]
MISKEEILEALKLSALHPEMSATIAGRLQDEISAYFTVVAGYYWLLERGRMSVDQRLAAREKIAKAHKGLHDLFNDWSEAAEELVSEDRLTTRR